MDRSADNRRVARLLVALAEREELTSYVAIQEEKGIDRTTLARWRDGKGRRTDWFENAETAFDLEPGTLHRIREGKVGVDEVLAHWDRVHHRDPGSVSYRAGSASPETSAFLASRAGEMVAETEGVLRDALIKQLRDHGVHPELPAPDEPDYELGWTDRDGHRCIAEVAAAAGSSDRLWAAMGRLLAAESQLEGEVRPFVVTEVEPSGEQWEVLRDRGVVAAWLGEWAPLGFDQENDQPAE